jgi:hypothetical protein
MHFGTNQYTHEHAQTGGLIRVFDRHFPDRPKSFDCLIHDTVRFPTFFPLRAPIKFGGFGTEKRVGRWEK